MVAINGSRRHLGKPTVNHRITPAPHNGHPAGISVAFECCFASVVLTFQGIQQRGDGEDGASKRIAVGCAGIAVCSTGVFEVLGDQSILTLEDES